MDKFNTYRTYLELNAHGKQLHHKCILMYKYMYAYMYVLVKTRIKETKTGGGGNVIIKLLPIFIQFQLTQCICYIQKSDE